MRRVTLGILVGVGAVLALLAVACAPSQPAIEPGPSGASSAPTARADTPGTGVAGTPSAQVLGEQGTPGAMATVGTTMSPATTATPAPNMTQSMFQEMDQFSNQLQLWAAGTPTPSDLMEMVLHASSLMDDLSQSISQMSVPEQKAALGKMSDIVGGMSQVMQTRARQERAMVGPGATPGTPGAMGGAPGGMMQGTPGPGTGAPGGMMQGTPGPGTGAPGGMMQGTPGPWMGTPGRTTQGTPVPGLTSATQQRMREIDQMRDQMMQMAADQPSPNDLLGTMNQMQGILASLSQQAGSLSPEDLKALTSNLARAMEDLVAVMDTHIRQAYGSLPPMTATPMPSTTP